jgi:hypothetical protein
LAKQEWRQSVESDGCGTAGIARVAAAVGTAQYHRRFQHVQQGEHSSMPCVQGVPACQAKH